MSELTVRRAETAEYEAVVEFYYKLIDDMQVFTFHPKWVKGVYPSEEYLSNAINNGEVYITLDEGAIAGAMVLNHASNEGYKSASWLTDATSDEAMVAHTIGVAADHMRQGIGSRMLHEAIKIAAENGQKSVRLDVLHENLPAKKLYESIGFHYIKSLHMYYRNTGWCVFDLYEYPLV